MAEDDRLSRLRFRIRTVLVVVALVALLLVVVVQQVQVGRQQAQIRQMRQQIDRQSIEKDKMTTIIRELRDAVARHK